MLLFSTDENLNIMEYSHNVLETADLKQEQIAQIFENSGERLCLESFVKDISGIMTKEFGSGVLPESPYTGLLNKMV